MADEKKKNSVEAEAMKQIRRRYSNLQMEYEDWKSHYIDIRDYMLPRHARSLDADTADAQNSGKKKHSKIIDSTAEDAIDILAAGMKSGLTSPARPWFRLIIQDKKRMQSKAVKEWLYFIEELIRTIFLQSNIYSVLHHAYMELPVFGTAATVLMRDYEKVIIGRQLTCGEYMLALNSKYQVDTFYRHLWMTPVQMVEQFGIENVTDMVKTAYENGNTESLYKVIHVIEPNDNRFKIANAKKKKFRSLYYEYVTSESESEKVLMVDGYENFPILSPRWHVVGSDAYGSCPGMKVLGDVKMLQKLNTKYLRAIDKVIDPPTKSDSTLKGKTINIEPGGNTFIDNKLQGQGEALSSLYEVRPDLGAIQQKIMDTRQSIKNGFYNNLFLMLVEQTGKMTATEVAERHQEKLTLLGPVLESIHGELLNPLIDTTYSFCLDAGLIPPPPEEIQDQPIKIEYVSILAQAQKLIGLQGIERVAGFIGNLAGVMPEARYKFDVFAAIDEYADAVGSPPSIIRDTKDAQQMQAAASQQMQAAQATEQAGQLANAASVMSKTDISRPNALTAIMGGPR